MILWLLILLAVGAFAVGFGIAAIGITAALLVATWSLRLLASLVRSRRASPPRRRGESPAR